MDLTVWLLAGAITAVAAVVQAVTGMGFNVVLVPALAVAAPAVDTVAILVATVAVMLMVVWSQRHHVSWPDLKVLLIGAGPGIVVGTLVADALPVVPTAILVGSVVIVASVSSMLAWKVAMTRRNLIVAGALGGALSPIAALPGPPVAVVYRPSDVDRMRATMSAFFAVTSAVSIVTLLASPGGTATDQFGIDVVEGLSMIPFLVIGLVLAKPLTRALSPSTVRTASLVLAGASGLTLVLNGISAL